MPTSRIPAAANAKLRYLASLAERVVATFIQAAIGVYLAALLAGNTSALSDASLAQKAALAGIAAAAALVKGLLAKGIGNGDTPAVLPDRLDPASAPATAVGVNGEDLRRG